MKTIYIIFNTRENTETWSSLYENLKAVFEDYVRVKICFLDEALPADLMDGDLFLVLYRERVYPMKDYVPSLDKVVVMSRTVQSQYLEELYQLPEGTQLLVVNDSVESTLQAANNLYALGLNHLNLVPYLPSEPNPLYREIKLAITPGEEEMVPPHVERIINIQSRCIDANTFITIINKLNLNNQLITRNLLEYTKTLATDGTGFTRKYVTENLKNEMLNQAFQTLDYGFILTDTLRSTVYSNDLAAAYFDLRPDSPASLKLAFGAQYEALFAPDDYRNRLFPLNGTNYIITRTTISVVDQMIGYAFRIRTEKDIKNLEVDISKQLVKSGLIAKYHFTDIIGQSDAMLKCLSLAKKVALTDFAVLISGESGTGKELLAQSIHNFSNRKNGPFVAINCAALPENLLESELFGYEKGAFTGASPHGKVGRFEQAHRGTIFLDEIGDMSLNLQARLLRVLQEQQLMRLGSDKVIDIDVRVIAATNRDLPEAIRSRHFREDLYYRLCNIPIHIPPLRQRKKDIPYIFSSFLSSFGERLEDDLIHKLTVYHWPGNVRELKNAADYYRTLHELPETILSAISGPGAPEARESPGRPAGAEPGPVFPPASRDQETLDHRILDIIRVHSSDTGGIGRVAILQLLHQQGVSLSDNGLRLRIQALREEGKILTSRGRTGCRLAGPLPPEVGNH